MQETSENNQLLRAAQRFRGIFSCVADPYSYPWQFIYIRHVLREIATGRAGAGEDGIVPPLLPSEESENVYWFDIGAPPPLGGSAQGNMMNPNSSHDRFEVEALPSAGISAQHNAMDPNSLHDWLGGEEPPPATGNPQDNPMSSTNSHENNK